MLEPGRIARLFARWEALIDRGIALYVRGLDFALRHRIAVVGGSFAALFCAVVFLGPHLRREYFPEVDAGAFEIAVRAPTGTRIELTEAGIAEVEDFIRKTIPEHDLEIIVSEMGVTPDWSAAYTPNAGPMDGMVKVQLHEHRSAFGPGICQHACGGVSPRTRISPTWNSPSIRAAWSAARSTKASLRR